MCVSACAYVVCVCVHIKCLVLSSLQDLSELFGCDLPDETSSSVRFTWRDGPFLRAMKQGEWIMLDEVSAQIWGFRVDACCLGVSAQ